MFSTLVRYCWWTSRALERCSSFNVVETLCLGYVFAPLPALQRMLP
jgi:hypothetical protein